MPVVGNRKETNNKGYMKDPLYKYCKQYLETVEGILTESKVDVFNESARKLNLIKDKEEVINCAYVNRYVKFTIG